MILDELINSPFLNHLILKEKLLLLEKISSQKSYLKGGRLPEPPASNFTNYHKILLANLNEKILVVGGEGVSTFSNVETLNINPDSNPNIIADIDKTILPDQKFDIVFFERIGFDYSLFGDKNKTIDANIINSLWESFRLLKSNGRLIIITGDDFFDSISYLLDEMKKFWAKSFSFDVYLPLHVLFENLSKDQLCSTIHYKKI